ncbi:unnamed protein product [Rhizoctonia solani]|uniref:BTB domain-containing protein n=1 Tax=Rhizoctonia solani TaxID=456999 RepID=A0A8H3B9V3_9AGAM|nr:unnamed protein product [Rhizoctonia solani]
MSNLHAYFHLRNLGAFRQLLDARGVSGNRVPDGKAGSGPRSWSQAQAQAAQAQMTMITQGGQLDNNPNVRDANGRTVLHLACTDLAPIALEFVRALLTLPLGQIDVNAQDTESGWTALHRALYAGNLPAAILLLGRSDIDAGIRDLEGMTPFDVYNATIEGTVPDPSPSISRELWVWGSNRNATLGTGSADDRAYPEAISILRPPEIIEKLSGSARFSMIGVRNIAMSRLHTSILTDEARANLEACGFGGVGRLGTKLHMQYGFGKVAGLENQTIIRVALGLDHTLALTSSGDVLSWGMNRFHQLGYVIEPLDSPGKPKANIDPSENQVQVSPKRVIGPLRKETIIGIAACKTASVCWTNEDLYSWGTNSGQLGYAKATPGWQVLPRKVATVSKVVDVALSDIAMVCLLPTKDIICFWNGAHFRIQFPQPVFPHRYQPPSNLGRIQIDKITCNDTVFAALTTAGEVFLFTLPDNPTSETDSGPNVRPQKVWALRRRVAAVRDVALGGDGTIIVCTASGHVFVNAPKPVKGPSIASGVVSSGVGSALLSGSYRTQKYQRVLGLQRIVNVAANSTGGFAALRADATIEPVIIEGKSMAQAIGDVQPYLIELQDVAHSFDLLSAINHGDDDDEGHDGILDDIILAEQLCQVVIRSRKENGFPSDLDHHVLHGADLRISGAINVPVHRAVLATRSLVLESILSGKPLTREGLVFKYTDKNTTLSISGCHALSILVLLNYLYSDTVCPIWDQRVRSPLASSFAFIKAQPGDIRLELQRLSRVLELPQLQFAVDSIGKRTPAPTLGPDFARLFQSSQESERPMSKGNICLELADRSVYCHSVVLRARSPFFASFFDEVEWTQRRWNDQGVLVVDMKHLEWRPMEYVFRYMCCGATDDLFDGIDFAQSVEEFIDFIFRVMSAANELMLQQLTEICSSIILRHVTLTNCITILADASPFYCPKLKARLHKYISVNMESLMEKRYLDDVSHDIMKELAVFVRGQQALKQPHTRSGAWIAAIMERHKVWLEMQDFPSVVVRTAPPARQSKISPKQSPTIGPTSPKTPRRVPSFNLPVTPQRSNTTKPVERTPQHDGMFPMDEEEVDPAPAGDSSARAEPPAVPLPELPPAASSPGTPSRVWKGTKTGRVDMRSIMADEAASSRPTRSPMVRITGFDSANQPPSPSKTPQKDRAQAPSRQTSQLATPPASASSSWRDPPAASGSPAQRTSETKLRPGEFPSLFEGSSRQRVPSTTATQPSGPSPASVSNPSAQQNSPAKPTRPAPAPAPAFPGLGPVIVPKRTTSGTESSRRRNAPDAWTSPPPMPPPPPGPSGSVSFSEIQQQQHAQKTGGAGKSKKSLLEIQAEEAERARLLQEEELARAREAEDLAAEIEFMSWWNAEEAKVKKEMEGNKAGGGGGKNRRKGRGGGGKRAAAFPTTTPFFMSNPQSAATKKAKRPRGLLASRKATDHQAESEPVAKKARNDDTAPQDPEEIKVQDWQDLDELFENALDALYGPNWTSALPLIRGVLHECARLVSVHGDPTLIYSPLEGQTSMTSKQTPASAFFTIYASAWLILSTFARNDSSLLTEDEPEDPLEYILSALAACEKGQQALDVRKQPKAWDLEFIWGRALVAAAQSLADCEEEPQGSENGTMDARARLLGPDTSAVLGRAFEHLTYAVKNCSRPTASVGEVEDEQKLKDERFVRALVEAAQGVLAVSESLQSEGKSSIPYLEGSRELLHHARAVSVPVELQIQVSLGLGQVELAIGSAMAEQLEVDSDEEATSVKGESEIRATAIQSLKEAIAKFDAVRELCAKQSDGKAEPVAEELKPMLQEALVTLATLLPEGPEQESMYSRYQAEGGVLDEGDESE